MSRTTLVIVISAAWLVAGAASAADADVAGDERISRQEHMDQKGDRIETKLDAKGDRIDQRLDNKGDRIDDRLDRRADVAAENGHDRKAAQLDRKGNQIDRNLNRKGDQANRRLDNKGNKHTASWDRRANTSRPNASGQQAGAGRSHQGQSRGQSRGMGQGAARQQRPRQQRHRTGRQQRSGS
jgi:hypothetical protein